MRKLFFAPVLLMAAINPSVCLSTSVVPVQDYSGVAAGLFGNMRTPAALIAGAIVPVGLLSAPKLIKGEPRKEELIKKANCLLAVASLLSEILAITYSTVAINKLAEIQFAPTASVSEFISKNFEFAWLGTNVHFLLGLFGFGILVGTKAYFLYGGRVAKIAGCWSLATFLTCTSYVNYGISIGESMDQEGFRFAKNLFGLTLKYMKLAICKARGRPLSLTAMAITLYSIYLTMKQLIEFISLSSSKNTE